MEIMLNANEYDLDKTFIPSFISSIYYKLKPKLWVKIVGPLAYKLSFKQVKGFIKVKCRNSNLTKDKLEEIAVLETGLWKGPYENFIKNLPSLFKPIAYALSQEYNGIRLPIAPFDFIYILIAVTLSKRSDYERFVLNWCRKIWKIYDGNYDRIAKSSMNELKLIGNSYQIFHLKKTLRSFMNLSNNLPKEIIKNFGIPFTPIENYLLSLPPELARISLIHGCWGIGPKIADSIILSTFNATHFIPCDTHLKTVLSRLGLINDSFIKMPKKILCSKFLCEPILSKKFNISLCPMAKNKSCIRKRLEFLKEIGGWFQTLIYLHGRNYCKTLKPKCTICPIKKFCAKAV
jgi:endonuclease III